MLENIDTKNVFTKMDLRWGYNNVRIKEGGIYYTGGILRTYSNVFQVNKFSSNISGYDKQTVERLN